MKRMTWEEYYLLMAFVASMRAECTRSKVGAVVTRDSRVVSIGYNGTPSGETHCTDGGCPRGMMTYKELPSGGDYSTCTGLHAEVNALAYANDRSRGSTVYITRAPCDGCDKILRAFGVSRVVYPEGELNYASE